MLAPFLLPGAGAVDVDITSLCIIVGREWAVEGIVGMSGDTDNRHCGKHHEGVIEAAVSAAQLNQIAGHQLFDRHSPAIGADRAVIYQKIIEKFYARP